MKHGMATGAERQLFAELVNLIVAAAFTEPRRQHHLVRPVQVNARLATALPSVAFPNRRLNAEASSKVRKQYLTVFSGRSTTRRRGFADMPPQNVGRQLKFAYGTC